MVIKVLEITLVCGKLFSHPPGLGHAGVLGTHLVKAGVSVPGLSPARGLLAEWSREKEPEQRVWVAQGWGRVGAGQWMCTGSGRAEELTNHPASLGGGSRGGIIGKPEHKTGVVLAARCI